MRLQSLLDQNWKFRLSKNQNTPIDAINTNDWLAADVPGTIHTDLLKETLIPDLFYGKNEDELQWIGEKNWEYQIEFDFPKEFDKGKTTYLYFKGLDTIAEIYLNDKLIGKTENMFISYRFEISSRLNPKANVLRVKFESALTYARNLIEKHGELFSARWPERSFIRKSQYSFGWDWGPAFPTMGIWKPVFLEQNSGVFIEACGISTFELNDTQAKLSLELELGGNAGVAEIGAIELSNDKHVFNKRFSIDNQLMLKNWIAVTEPDLWWPNGHGDPNLYDLKVSLLDTSGKELDRFERKIGIRNIELDLGDETQRAFRFKVNNEPVYIKGANWIPADSFIPRITDEIYDKLISQASEANMNMLRVWGGGIYEQDIFYEKCDALGIMVWQDFMFACASYWEDPDFLATIGIEVKQNIQRLQHHPCIAIWCGNNENEWIWYREGMGPYSEMPGIKIFHQILPDLVQTYDPYRMYWPTSPFGEEEDPNDEFSGNRHSWDIWSRWVDYTDVDEDRSLFVTEFGFQGPANVNTLNSVIPEEERFPQSEVFEFHNKQTEGNERLFRFLAAHLPVKARWQDFLYLTQLNQGLALQTCLEHWRHRWPETSGSIIWQLNDCWPVSSWSLVDSSLQPKMSYFFVKRAFTNIHCQIQDGMEGYNVHFTSDEMDHLAEQLHIAVLNIDTGLVSYEMTSDLVTGSKSRIIENVVNNDQLLSENKWAIIVSLTDEDKKIIFRNYYVQHRWKHIRLQPVTIKKIIDNDELVLKSDKAAFFVDLHHPFVHFADRGFILLPEEEYRLSMIKSSSEPVNKDDIEILTLNKYWNNIDN